MMYQCTTGHSSTSSLLMGTADIADDDLTARGSMKNVNKLEGYMKAYRERSCQESGGLIE